MSTLDDLRETLGRHAEGLDDTGRHVRAAAVRRRARLARRRRTVATAVAATAVLVGGAGAVASWPDGRQADVATPTVVDVAVPEEVSIHGFPYELSDSRALEDAGDTLRLEASDESRALVLVGTDLGSGSATLYVDDVAVARVFAGDQVGIPVPLPPSDARTAVRVEVDRAPTAPEASAPAGARTGVAIYDATGDLAPGLANDDRTAVFRSVIAGESLETASFAPPGATRMTTTLARLSSATRTTWLCRTDEPDLWVHVTSGGNESRGRCGPGSGPDAGVGSSWSGGADRGLQRVEVTVTRGEDGPVAEDPDLQLGVARYGAGETTRVGGTEVTTVVEHAGRTWRLDTELSQGGSTALRLAADTDLLLGIVAKGREVHATWKGDLSSGSTGYFTARSQAPSTMVDTVLLRGDTYDVELVSEGELETGALLVYRPE